MPKITAQMALWQSRFGRLYTERNTYSPKALDAHYLRHWGTSLSAMNRTLYGGLDIGSVLEVGCNIGMKLKHLQGMGYENLYGIELQQDAVERAKQRTRGINIVQGSAFDIPFKDNFFDLVFTNGLLIHIHPKDICSAMREIYRCSARYISGLEYYAEKPQAISYRGKRDALWKNDFPGLFQRLFPSLKLLRIKKYFHRPDDSLCDVAYLFEK